MYISMATANYGFTMKCIKKDYVNTCSDLLFQANDMIDRFRGELCDYSFEKDSIDRYHIHGWFKARKGIKRNLYKKHYWHIHIDFLPSQADLENWISYINKGYFKEAIQNYAFEVLPKKYDKDDPEFLKLNFN